MSQPSNQMVLKPIDLPSDYLEFTAKVLDYIIPAISSREQSTRLEHYPCRSSDNSATPLF